MLHASVCHYFGYSNRDQKNQYLKLIPDLVGSRAIRFTLTSDN